MVFSLRGKTHTLERALLVYYCLGHSSGVEEDIRPSPWPVLSRVSSILSECSSDCVTEYLKLHDRSFSLLFLQESLSWALLQELQPDTELGMFHVEDLAVSKLLMAHSQKHQKWEPAWSQGADQSEMRH